MGGADHKTGSKIDLSNAYNILEDEVRKYYPDCTVLYKWNTEDCITLDKIPYIGEFSHFMPNMYIGTGFNKWGMTSSNVAANIIVDKILGRDNEYKDVFKATRLQPIKNNAELGNMIKDISIQCGFKVRLTYHVARHCALSLSLKLNGLQRLAS